MQLISFTLLAACGFFIVRTLISIGGPILAIIGLIAFIMIWIKGDGEE